MIPGKYRHYKGNLYEVLGTALHSETKEELVVYRAMYEVPGAGYGSLWVRPRKMFEETVLNAAGNQVPRFQKITD